MAETSSGKSRRFLSGESRCARQPVLTAISLCNKFLHESVLFYELLLQPKIYKRLHFDAPKVCLFFEGVE